jgi:hypothetical protein
MRNNRERLHTRSSLRTAAVAQEYRLYRDCRLDSRARHRCAHDRGGMDQFHPFRSLATVRDVRSLRFIDATVLGGQGYSVHYDQLEFLRQNSHSFREGAALSGDDLNVYSANGEPQVVHGISANYFQTLAVQPELGRFFQPEVHRPQFSPKSFNKRAGSTAD